MTNEITQADRDLLRQAYEQEGYLTLPDFLLHDTAPILVERVALRAISAARRQASADVAALRGALQDMIDLRDAGQRSEVLPDRDELTIVRNARAILASGGKGAG